jgi:hypothetical protein
LTDELFKQERSPALKSQRLAVEAFVLDSTEIRFCHVGKHNPAQVLDRVLFVMSILGPFPERENADK